jgi:hypothetical protein
MGRNEALAMVLANKLCANEYRHFLNAQRIALNNFHEHDIHSSKSPEEREPDVRGLSTTKMDDVESGEIILPHIDLVLGARRGLKTFKQLMTGERSGMATAGHREERWRTLMSPKIVDILKVYQGKNVRSVGDRKAKMISILLREVLKVEPADIETVESMALPGHVPSELSFIYDPKRREQMEETIRRQKERSENGDLQEGVILHELVIRAGIRDMEAIKELERMLREGVLIDPDRIKYVQEAIDHARAEIELRSGK